MSLSLVPYITTSFFCTWKSACQHGEKKGPEWGIYRVVSASFGSRHGIRQPFMSLNQRATFFEGKQPRFLLCLWHLGTQKSSVAAFYTPGQNRFCASVPNVCCHQDLPCWCREIACGSGRNHNSISSFGCHA